MLPAHLLLPLEILGPHRMPATGLSTIMLIEFCGAGAKTCLSFILFCPHDAFVCRVPFVSRWVRVRACRRVWDVSGSHKQAGSVRHGIRGTQPIAPPSRPCVWCSI